MMGAGQPVFPWIYRAGCCRDAEEVARRSHGGFVQTDAAEYEALPLPAGYREEDVSYLQKLPAVYCPRRFVADFPHAFAHGEGVVFLADGSLCREVSVCHGYPADAHPVLGRGLLYWQRLRGRTAVLASRGGDCYYHWMFDILPRLELLEGRDFEHILVQTSLPFQRESLEALGILEKALPTVSFGCRRFDHLIVPSLPGYSGMPNHKTCEFLRKRLGATSSRAPLRLYISRGDVAKRRVVEEERLCDDLKAMGFTVCRLSGMPHREQIELFASAEIVVAPHGASLTNAVFCPPGTSIVELLHPGYAHWCYRALAEAAGLSYHYHVPPSSPSLSHDSKFAAADILVDRAALLRQLAEILS